MSRPPVTVVMPFAGDGAAARTAEQALLELRTGPGDELLLVDNSECGAAVQTGAVSVVRATVEHSPAYARNVGAERAGADWILFLDADCRASPELLDQYFAGDVAADVGALAGEVIAETDSVGLSARYGAARSFLSQEAHLAHPYRPRAVAANLMVRRSAFEQVGGFYEGIRAAEDTDFSWRLEQAGWRLELRPGACARHTYRATIGELRRQWRGYAAGRAWLARRYDGFQPEPAVRRALSRRGRRGGGSRARGGSRAAAPTESASFERVRYLVLDVLLGVEELAGLTLSNRPAGQPALRPAAVVLLADRFPAPDDPAAGLVRALERARVEALARPTVVARGVARELQISYSEDDGIIARAGALLRLAVRHPVLCVRDLMSRESGAPTLRELAPAAIRLEREPGARLVEFGRGEAHALAGRLAALVGRPLDAAART